MPSEPAGPDDPPVAALLRAWRRRARLTQEELAEQASLGVRTIRDVELGRVRRPRPESIRLLADALDLAGPDRALFEAAARSQPRAGWLADGPDSEPTSGSAAGPAHTDAALAGPTTQVRPAQLPADVAGFTGRAAELAELDRLLPASSQAVGTAAGTPVVISAVAGTAGVGKTALAIRWAHRVRGAFPDGQLYVNLRGYDPQRPMPAADALAGFMRALGVAGPDLALPVDERAALYRSLLDGRRLLVVLDNAASVEQVRPLLPGTSTCLVLVTSRDSLVGLVARHGAHRLELDLLPRADAVALLRALVGARADAEPAAAATLAVECAGLPLALRLTAELAAARPAAPLARLVQELADEQRRLDLLDAGGDPRTAVRAVFSWSYQQLPAAAARAFRLLGLTPAPAVDRYAAAALTGTTAAEASQLLDLLARAHLVQPVGSERWGMHDLLRGYAAGLVADLDPPDARRAALSGLFDAYLAAAAAAVDTLYPADQRRRPQLPAAAGPIPPLADPAAARSWLDAERATLVATAGYTAAHGWPAHTVQLSAIVHMYLDAAGHYLDALTVHQHALDAASRSGDSSGAARALGNLGTVHWRLGRYSNAAGSYHQARAAFAEVGDRVGEARMLGNLGIVAERMGRYGPAAEHHQQALALHQETGDRYGAANALNNLGLVYSRLGRHQQAADQHRLALAGYREIADRGGEADALDNLGIVHMRLGEYGLAVERHEQALAGLREIGDRDSAAHALNNLGVVYMRLGRFESAADLHQQALCTFRELGDKFGAAYALDNLGVVHMRLGNLESAAELHRQALCTFREIGDRGGEAAALTGIGLVHARRGRPDRAALRHRQALALFQELGILDGEAAALNGLAESLAAVGRTNDAAREHTAALAVAAATGNRYEQTRAHAGLANTGPADPAPTPPP